MPLWHLNSPEDYVVRCPMGGMEGDGLRFPLIEQRNAHLASAHGLAIVVH